MLFKRFITPLVLALSLSALTVPVAGQVVGDAPSAPSAPVISGSPEAAARAENPERPRVAVVLSGGSALGIAHVGVLKVIEKAGIPIDMIVGTSMGAVVGGLYAAGYSPQRMEQIVTHLDWNSVFSERRGSPGDRYDLLKRERYPIRLGFDSNGLRFGAGLLDGQNVLALFTQLTLQDLTVRNFDGLPVRYRAVAADIRTGEKVVISHGSLADAMRASMSIPGVFRPYDIDGKRLVDGGIVDNLPVDVAREMGANIVIAVECRSSNPKAGESLESGLAITAQTFNLFVQQNMEPNRKLATILIRPDLSGFGVASYGDARALVMRGEAGAEAVYPELEKLAKEIAATRPLVRPSVEPNRSAYDRPLPTIARVRVEGGDSSEERLAREAFDPLTGKVANRDAIREATDSLYASGHFDLVKFDLLPERGRAETAADMPTPAGAETPVGGAPPARGAADEPAEASPRAVAVVRLVPDLTPDSAIFIGASFRALFTTVTDSHAEVGAAAMIGDLTGKDSAFYVEGSLLDKERVYAEYFQPVGPLFFMPFFRYEEQFDAYYVTRADIISTLYRTTGGGAWAGVELGRHADLMASYSYESILAYGIIDSTDTNTVTALTGAFRFDTMTTSVFPERGFATIFRGRWADRLLGGNTDFTALEWYFDAALPLTKGLTLGVAGYAATDFSGILAVNGTLPPERYFSIRQPAMFYGLEPNPQMGIGDNVGALALELRAKLGSLSPLLGGDLFAIANISAAAVQLGLSGDYPFYDYLPLRWDGSLGIGLRLTSRIGLLIALGLVDDGNETLEPQRLALSIDFGNFAKLLEDMR